MIIINIIIMYTFKEIRDTLPQIPSSPSRIDVPPSPSILDVPSSPSLICKENSIKYVSCDNNSNDNVLDESRDERLRYEYYRGIFYRRAIYQDDLSKINIIQIENCKLYNFKRSRSNSNDYLPESKRHKKIPRCIFRKRLSKKEDTTDV
jgi:hypothetical protein